MADKTRVLFIINPVSGGKKWEEAVACINELMPPEIHSEIFMWKMPEQHDEIIQKISTGNYDIAVAVGGDGTMNMVAEAILYSPTKLGIIPIGSGNGFARDLGIPLNIKSAVETVIRGQYKTVDAASINGKFFFCTSGVGFDALIGAKFAESKVRGFWSYASIVLSELRRYRSKEYTVNIDGKEIIHKAFLMTFANASQYGNNCYISPDSSLTDGMINVCFLKPFKWYNIPSIAFRLFNKTIDQSRFYDSYTGNNIKVTNFTDIAIHYDGEPGIMTGDLEVNCHPGALKVIIG